MRVRERERPSRSEARRAGAVERFSRLRKAVDIEDRTGSAADVDGVCGRNGVVGEQRKIRLRRAGGAQTIGPAKSLALLPRKIKPSPPIPKRPGPVTTPSNARLPRMFMATVLSARTVVPY